MKHYIVGCGGIGAWLAHVLVRQLPKDHEIVLIDGDEVEEKNLNRQFFSESDVGGAKVLALAERLRALEPNVQITPVPEYLDETDDIRGPGHIYCCADNHPARVLCLQHADNDGQLLCFIAGNEYYEAEAMFYHPQWQDTTLDPRVYYPELLADRTGDPRFPDSCTGEAQNAKPQLATANLTAATFVMNLLTWWTQQAADQKFDPASTQKFWPVHLQLGSGAPRAHSVQAKHESITNGPDAVDLYEFPPVINPAFT